MVGIDLNRQCLFSTGVRLTASSNADCNTAVADRESRMPRHPLGKDPSSYPSNARPDANRPAFRPASGHPSTSSAAAVNAGLIHPAELKAFSRRDDALDEAEWLESKFQRSGAPEPAEGELTVVIDYCYNSGPDQLTTRHNPKEFHEEAELVRQYFLNYHTGATVFVVSASSNNTFMPGLFGSLTMRST